MNRASVAICAVVRMNGARALRLILGARRTSPFPALWFLVGLLATGLSCGHTGGTTCSDPKMEATGIPWDQLSGQIAYSRWENPITPGAEPGCVFLIDVRAHRVEVLRDVPIGQDSAYAPVGWARD